MDTSPTSHPDDEALSGALDQSAADRSEDGQAIAAHLAGCVRCTHRQEELAAARDALAAAPVEPLDDLTRRRLVARALADPVPASPPRRRVRHPVLTGSVAAAILALLVAVPFVTRDGRTDNRTM